MNLSDLGAEVIKVEIPGRGDDTRAYPPFINDVSSYFLSLNRGKKSITLNMKDEKAVEIVHKLAAKCDIVVENFRPGVTSRLKADYETLKKINPKIIYCSISSFGQTGPYAQWPGYDLIIQGMSGLMGITGEKEGTPMRVGVAVEDINAGLHAVISILAALRVRDQTGVGQYIDLSMLDAGVTWMTYMAGNYFSTGNVPQKMGAAHPSIVPYQSFKTGDGKYLLVAAGNDRLYKMLCETIGRPELVEDSDYLKNDDRVAHRETLIDTIEGELKKQPRDHWLASLREKGFPCAPVYTMDEVFSDEQILHRGMLVEMEHPTAGAIKQIGTPFKFSESKTGLTTPPPELGADTDGILAELGYSEEEIKALREQKVV